MTCKWNTKDDAWSNLNCTQIVSPSNHTHQENNKKSKEPAKKLHQQQTKWISQMQHVIVWEVHSMQGACNSVYAACAQHVNSCGNRFRPRNFCPHKADLEVALSTRILSEILPLRRAKSASQAQDFGQNPRWQRNFYIKYEAPFRMSRTHFF